MYLECDFFLNSCPSIENNEMRRMCEIALVLTILVAYPVKCRQCSDVLCKADGHGKVFILEETYFKF